MNIPINDLKENLEKKIEGRSFYNKLCEISPVINFTTKCYGPGNLSIPVRDDTDYSSGASYKLLTLKDYSFCDVIPIPKLNHNDYNYNDYDYIVEYMFNLFAENFRITEERAILQGDEKIEIKGLSKLTNVLETKSPNAITIYDLIEVKNKVYNRFRPKICWVMSYKTRDMLELLKDDMNNSLLHEYNFGISKGIYETLLGYPVYVSENMPEPTPGGVALYFGDFSEVMCKFSKTVNLQILYESFPSKIRVELEFDAKLKDNDTKKIAALKFKA